MTTNCSKCGAPIKLERVEEREHSGYFREWYVWYPNEHGVPIYCVVKVSGNVRKGDKLSGKYLENYDQVVFSPDPGGVMTVSEPAD